MVFEKIHRDEESGEKPKKLCCYVGDGERYIKPSDEVLKYLEKRSGGFAFRATKLLHGTSKASEKQWFHDVQGHTKKPIHIFCTTQMEKQDFILEYVLHADNRKTAFQYHVFRDIYYPGCRYGREAMLVNASLFVYAIDFESFQKAFDPEEWQLIYQ